MEFEDKENWDNNTFGLSAKGDVFGLTLYGELAWQDKAGFGADDDAFYFHAIATKKFGTQYARLGVEQLNAGFKTPLATVHAFNGWADVFDHGRISGTHNGLTDVYASHTMPIFCGIKWTNVFHAFGDNEISTGYGWEYDSLLVKKFNDNFTAIAKFAFFESEGDPYIAERHRRPGHHPLLDRTQLHLLTVGRQYAEMIRRVVPVIRNGRFHARSACPASRRTPSHRVR